jgi:hypothetical protein
MKITKRQLRRIILEEKQKLQDIRETLDGRTTSFTPEKRQNFDSTLEEFEMNFKASCENAALRIAQDGNHNTHEALEFLAIIVNDVIEDLFETMPM